MFADRLTDAQNRVQQCLLAEFKKFDVHSLTDAMQHSLQGGKTFRGFLALESARLHGVPQNAAIWAACAVETMHCYSLIHDDLPCMDDDDLRRGHPTVHIKWDEATAVLAGDALQTLAFQLLTKSEIGPPECRIDLLESFAQAAGALGMVMGQAQDIAAEASKTPLSLKEISELQAKKTGALIVWSATVGPRIANAELVIMTKFAERLGLAFQVADDILDIEGDERKTGKRLKKDTHAGKATFVSLLGLEAARIKARQLVEEAENILEENYGPESQVLQEAARFAISREM